MTALPFLSLSRALSQPLQGPGTRPQPAPPRAADAAFCAEPVFESRAQQVFEAAVRAVQTRLNHLTCDEIRLAAPALPDAGFARQIASHLAIRHFGVPLKRLSRDLPRSTESLHRALRAVDARLDQPLFFEAYAAIAAEAEIVCGALREGVSSHG
jgi:hypothetical protein